MYSAQGGGEGFSLSAHRDRKAQIYVSGWTIQHFSLQACQVQY